MIDHARLTLLKNSLIRINTLSSFKVEIPKLHPDSPKYVKFWSEQFKYCVEGYWGLDGTQYRFMPPTLYFYSNFFKILHTDRASKSRYYIKPYVRDLDWMIHYSYLIAQGFSGFADDDLYSCDKALLNEELLDKLKNSAESSEQIRYSRLFNLKGELKKYVDPWHLLKNTHKQPLGKPWYSNPACNLMLFGSRGGGKSYTIAGITAHTLTFDGIKEVTEQNLLKPPKAEVCIGAGQSEKSADIVDKVVAGLNAFGTHDDLGVWGKPGNTDYTPMPFYRDWIGSVAPGNKAKNPFRYEYEVQTESGWQLEGSGTKLVHVNYSDKKQGGAEAAAGGRYLLNVYEEVGLQPNFIDALLSNIGTVSVEGEQMGVQIGLGTSGNLDLVQQSKKVFTSPDDYNFLSFEDIWEDNGKIGFFIPAYLSDASFKDANGNTDVEKALKHYYNRREQLVNKNDPKLINAEKMNYPLVPSDMWVSSKGHYFPVVEALERERELLKHDLYKYIGTPVHLVWDSKYPYGVKHTVNEEAEPFYEFPYTRSMTSSEGCIMIYEHPKYEKGEIPNDLYIFTLDPYVAENIEDGESLGVLFGFLNPKYTKDGYNGNFMVCSYIGKHLAGTSAFYENCEKIMAYYGNPRRGLWYEANRGSSVRDYFIKKNKLYLLAPRPNKSKGSNMFDKRVADYGYWLSNKLDKIEAIQDTHDWLLSKTMYDGQPKRVIETIPCIFTIRQMINFTLDKKDNFDAISALIGFPLALKEMEHNNIKEEQKAVKHNPLAFLSVNPNIFKDDLRKFRYQDNYRSD